MARPASGRSDVITRAPLVVAAELGEAGMVLQMLSDSSNGGRQWLRENPEGRVAAILELIASRTTTDIETSKKIMETIEIHHKGEAEAAGYKKHMYYKGADWAGSSQAAEAAEELREMGRLKGTACESRPCMNGGVCTDLLQGEEDDMYNLDGAYDRCAVGIGYFWWNLLREMLSACPGGLHRCGAGEQYRSIRVPVPKRLDGSQLRRDEPRDRRLGSAAVSDRRHVQNRRAGSHVGKRQESGATTSSDPSNGSGRCGMGASPLPSGRSPCLANM